MQQPKVFCLLHFEAAELSVIAHATACSHWLPACLVLWSARKQRQGCGARLIHTAGSGARQATSQEPAALVDFAAQ